MTAPPADLFPITQATAHAAFDWIFAPWIKQMGFCDFVVREGYCSMRLPLNDKLKFFTGSVCGQALMAAIDTAASMATATTPRMGKGTVYQHTHFVRPAANDDFLVEARDAPDVALVAAVCFELGEDRRELFADRGD